MKFDQRILCLELWLIARYENTLIKACLIFVELYRRAQSSVVYQTAEGILIISENVQKAFRL